MKSAVLRDFRNTKTITIPQYQDSQIEIYDGILYGDSKIVGNLNSAPGDPLVAAQGLVKMIKSWNFVDEEGKPIPVGEEALLKMSNDALAHLAQECTAFISEKKSQ